MATERFAAIDVGSNSVRCLIAERGDDGHLHTIDDLKDQPRLARGLAATGRLSDEAMQRAIEAIGRMSQAAERRGVSKIALVATSAVRDATNGKEFADRVQTEIGIPLEIIDGETEARLAFLSVREHFAIVRGRSIIADIGGGSLELVLAVGGLVEHVVTVPFGAVRTTEQFLTGGDVDAGVRRLRSALRQKLRRLVPAREWSGARLFGSGGTWTNAARILAAREKGGETGGVHGTHLHQADFERLLEYVSRLSFEERLALPGLNPERADIIVAGLAVAAETVSHFDSPDVTVSAFGLREGLLLHLSQPVADGNGKGPTRGKALRRFADRCRTDRRHVEQVLKLARRLYDHLGARMGVEQGDWELLEAASLLHDVGQLVSYRGHHKHSYHLIVHAESLPLTPRERQLIAIISRYHRKTPPRKKHAEYAALPSEDRARVKRLAALLRVADGLDRGHVAAVDNIRMRISPTRLVIDATPHTKDTDLKLEVWGAKRKADLLEKELGLEVVVKAANTVTT